jgi:hypothetical protein
MRISSGTTVREIRCNAPCRWRDAINRNHNQIQQPTNDGTKSIETMKRTSRTQTTKRNERKGTIRTQGTNERENGCCVVAIECSTPSAVAIECSTPNKQQCEWFYRDDDLPRRWMEERVEKAGSSKERNDSKAKGWDVLERIDCCMRYDMSFTHESHVQARGDILQ